MSGSQRHAPDLKSHLGMMTLAALVPFSLSFTHAHWYYRGNIMSTLNYAQT